jgi:hypothetical protein
MIDKLNELPSIFTPRTETSLIDKVISRENIARIEELVRKPNWKYEDVNTALYLLTAEETKLLNLTQYERYLLGKFYAWIREFVKFVDDLIKQKEKAMQENLLTSEMIETLDKTINKSIDNVRFLIDVFLYISRSSLSINAKAFEELLKNRFEYEYSYPTQPEQPKAQTKTEIKLFGGR